VIYDDPLATKRTVAALHQRIRTCDARFLSMRRRELRAYRWTGSLRSRRVLGVKRFGKLLGSNESPQMLTLKYEGFLPYLVIHRIHRAEVDLRAKSVLYTS
jgi:hypothetical protein